MEHINQRDTAGRMRIGKLSERSEVPASTIRYYQKIGLLPEPERQDSGQATYGPEHLKRLLLIRHLRQEYEFSPKEIRQQVDNINYFKQLLEDMESGKRVIGDGEQRLEIIRSRSKTEADLELRDKIIEAAIYVFSRKGYHKASIKEIVDQIGVSPGVVYNYFQNKQELFLAAATTVIDLITSPGSTDTGSKPIRTEEDFFKRLYERAVNFVGAYPGFMDMWNVMKTSATDEEMQEYFKAEGLSQTLLRTIKPDFEEAMAAEVIREYDPELAALNFIGMLALLSYGMLLDDTPRDIEDAIRQEYDFLMNGLRKRP